MNIEAVLHPEMIAVSNQRFEDKDDCFRYLTELFAKNGYINDKESFLKSLYERENMGTTYMGDHLAVPHGWSDSVVTPTAALCRCKPFLYQSAGEEDTVERVAMLAVPSGISSNAYMRTLAILASLLMNESFSYAFKTEDDPNKIIACANQEIKRMEGE